MQKYMIKMRFFLKMMVMFESILRVNGNVGNVIDQCENDLVRRYI